ncbi:MAG: hypothetical protein OYH77_05595 [Pseudomonadota bacterium]|nr:hypothetical protein [Pseudomonadota bacterium]
MLAFLATLGAGLLSLLLWYVLRSKQRRVWLPLLAVLQVRRRTLPRLIWQRPPLLALVCFIAAWLALLAYTTSPSYSRATANAKQRLYVYIDFSASVSARLDIVAFRKFLQAQWHSWQERAVLPIRIATSHNDEQVHAFSSERGFAAYLQQLDFHHHATHIATSLQQQGERLREYGQILIVSDYDAYSWRDIYWQPALEHLPVPRHKTATSNLYLHRVETRAQGIEVTVARAGVAREVAFTLQISHGKEDGKADTGKVLASTHGIITANQAKTYLHINYLPRANTSYQLQLLGVADDAISIDNTYLFTGRQRELQALIIADLYGERAIDDPLYQVHTALEVLGLKVSRQDQARAVAHDLLVLAYDRNFSADEHCLLSAKKIWLMPQTLGANSLEACRCYQRLTAGQISSPQVDNACAGKSWQEVLQASNAKHEQLWWRKGRVIVFAVPPHTLQAAQLPIITKHLLTTDGLLAQLLTTDDLHVPKGESLLQERELPTQINATVQSTQQEYVWAQALMWFVCCVNIIELLSFWRDGK